MHICILALYANCLLGLRIRVAIIYTLTFSIDLCPPNKHAIKRIEVAVYNMMRRICCLYRGEVVIELTPLTYMFRMK